MSFRPFTQPWADRFREEINASEAYRTAGAGWSWPLALVMDATPVLGYADADAVLLELSEGHCHAARAVPAADAAAPFTVRGDYGAWKDVMLGTLDPVTGIMRKRLRFEGSLATLMLHARGASALVACATRVPTRFPDESAP